MNALGAALLGGLIVVTSLAEPATFQEVVDHVNSKAAGWTAAVPSRFGSFTDVANVCGTVLSGNISFQEPEQHKTSDDAWTDDIPVDFDARNQFKSCAIVIGHVRDQSTCGSCWAFASTEALNDRRCIATGDTSLLSVEDTTANCGLLSCFSMGCNGGQPSGAWRWFKSTGVVTGGDYGDIGKGDSCAPYSLQPCAHHVQSSKYPPCSGNKATPRIGKRCTEKGFAKSYKADKKRASSSYSLNSVKSIQQDLLKYGSVTAAFTVYADFPTYTSGIYGHTTGSPLGGHAVKIIGWGTESGQDYWRVVNSWNCEWGDGGMFKIRRGNNECGIEGQVVAGTVAREGDDQLVV